MQDTLYYNFFASGYYIFANGILLITLASVMHGFDREMVQRFHIRWLATGLFATGISRILLSLALLSHELPVIKIECGFVILSLHLYWEYMRQEYFKSDKLKPWLLHPILFAFLAYSFYLSGYEQIVRSSTLLTTGIILTIIGFRATCRLPEEVSGIAKNCFAIGLVGYLVNLAVIYPLTGNLQNPPTFSSEWLQSFMQLLPSILIVILTIFAMWSRHIREKVQWYNLRSDMGMTSHLFFLTLIIFILIGGFIVGNRINEQQQFHDKVILSQSIQRLTQLINHRMLMASNYSAAVAAAPSLVDFLEHPNSANHKIIKTFFSNIAPTDSEVVCYLVGNEGKILAASNLNDEIIGFDVSFRDYYKKAMSGIKSDMIDYGALTNELGFYSIQPIVNAESQKVLGACVVKRKLTDLEDLLRLYHPAMIINDKEMVFIASDRQFEHRRFIECTDTDIHSHIQFVASDSIKASPIVTHGLHAISPLRKEGWRVVMLTTDNHTSSNTIWLMITLSLLSMAVVLVLNSTVISIRSREDYAVIQERFQTVFYHAPESMLIISARDLTILEANQSMTRQFGLNDEIIGKSYFSLLPPNQHEFNNVWHNHSEKLFKHQRDFLRSNGEIFSAEVTGSPIIFNYDRAIILLLHDITAQKQIEHKLRQAKNAAEEANKLKSRFFANASHEIRTPMTAIIGLTEMALSNSQTPEQHRILRLARSSSQALLELVNDILDLSRIESGKFSIRFHRFDLHQLLKEVCQLYELETSNSPIKIVSELADDLPKYVISDSVRIRQILLNLFSNAKKFTAKGSITLTAKVISNPEQERLQVKIIDTGSGIAPAQQKRLFEPFTQRDQYTRKESRGAGLGLAICKQIADLLAGCIYLEKTDSSGSTFVLEIPIARAKNEQTTPSLQVNGKQLIRQQRPMHFLVADDNEINLLLAGSIIEKFGGTHSFARDGKEALEKVNSEEFDLALLDIQMPELDGLSVIRKIRAGEGQTADLPMIAVSAFISDQEKQEALQAGANAYLVKPYLPADLLQAIENLIEPENQKNHREPEQTPAVEKAAETFAVCSLKQIDAAELEIRILKKPENILKISDIFSRRSVELMAELAACEKSNDSQKLREITHSIKGLVGMLGARKAFEFARNLEELCKNEKLDEVLPQLATLRQQIEEIAQDLKLLEQQVKRKSV